MAITLFERWSPEYALNNAFEDMRLSGIDGLKKHLTENALKKVESIESFTENYRQGDRETGPLILKRRNRNVWTGNNY